VRALVLSSLAVVVAGCGAGTHPAVVNLGATTGAIASKPVVPNGGSFQLFADCMTRHGVTATIGRGGHGVSIVGSPGQSQLDAAQTACREYMPGGGPPTLTPAQEARSRAALFTFAKCMRAHGVASFPDPTSNVLDPGNVDASTPQFKTALSACQSDLRNFKGPRMIR
jgi:hypothetical protein